MFTLSILKDKWHLYVMSSFYLFTGIAHFTNPNFFLDVMPAFMPTPRLLVDLSGYAEIILALALLSSFLRKTLF